MIFPLSKSAIAEYSAELMVYFEKHKIIEIITRLTVEIANIRPSDAQQWIATNIRRIANEFYQTCLAASYTNTKIDYFKLPRNFHHRIVLFGRSGSGRKSQAYAIAKRFNLIYIDVDALICRTFFHTDPNARQLQKAFTDAGDKAIISTTAKAKSVAVAKLVQQRLIQMDALRQGWVMLNYPRNVDEFIEMFEHFKTPPNKLIYLQCNELMAMQRLVTKPDLGCPQNNCKYMTYEMKYFAQNEKAIDEYLARRHETIYVDAEQCFEAVRNNLWAQMERLPYVMGYKYY